MLVSGSRTRESPFELEYTEDEEYIAPPVVTSLVLIEAEEECDPLQALRCRDDKEEDSMVDETVESSEDKGGPQENKVPLPIRIVRSSQKQALDCSGSSSSKSSAGFVTDRSVDLCLAGIVGGVARHPTSPEA